MSEGDATSNGEAMADITPRAQPETSGATNAVAHDVLVVEDDPEINEIVGAYAQIAGFGYRAATTGEAAFHHLHHRLPALIVLDLMLPDADGLEICRRVKSESATARVPVLILTAMDNEDTRRQGLACGAVGYLVKPFDPDHLIDAIHRHARNGHPPRQDV